MHKYFENVIDAEGDDNYGYLVRLLNLISSSTLIL